MRCLLALTTTTRLVVAGLVAAVLLNAMVFTILLPVAAGLLSSKLCLVQCP